MLRRMPLPPRVVSRTLTLSCALLASAAPLACQQIQEWTGGAKPDAAKTDAPAGAPGTDTPTAVAVPPSPALPAGAATLDSLLGLVQADSSGSYMILRHPQGLLDLGDEAVKFYDGPVQALVDMLGAQDLASGFRTIKAGLGDLRGKLGGSGVDLSRGLVATQTGPDSTVLVVAASQPDAVRDLMSALHIDGADRLVCKAIEAAPGYVGCADSEAVVAAYRPGDGARRRAAAEAALPGVALDELQVLGFVAEDGGSHLGLSMPPGLGVLHFGLPASASQDLAAVLQPGPADTLRFARPGTGFLWMRTDVAEVRRRAPELGASGQPQVDAAVAAWNGELFFGGSSDPAAMQLRLGLGDVKPMVAAIEFAGALATVGASNMKEIPGFPGSKLAFETREVTIGTEVTKALHLGVSGVPQAEVVTQLIGLTPNLWLFAADHSLAIAAGVDADSVVRLVAPPTADATLASLPPALAADLRADRVGFVMHTPVDALQGPSMRQVFDAALKDVAGYKPEQVRSGLAMVAPMSAATLWITETASQPVVHLAVQSIGHTADEEGKAALAAALAVATGGDPAALFGELIARYPSSPRLAAYQARAGSTGPGVLAGSGVAGMMLSGAVAWMMLEQAAPALSPEDLAAAELAHAATLKAAEEAAAAELAAAEAAEAAAEAQAAAEAAKASGDAAAKKEAEDARKAAEAAKKKADAAAAKKKAEAAAKAKAEADAKAKAEAEAKKKAEEAANAPMKAGQVRPTRVGRQN